MIKSQMFIGAALLAGVAIGYFAGDQGQSVSPMQGEETSYVAKKAVADHGDAATISTLRKRVAELERILAEKDARTETAISNAVVEAVKTAGPGGPRGNPREWLENIKKTDPARYSQMTNRFTQWRRRRMERTRTTLEYLSSIDTSQMSGKAKAAHAELQELIVKREDLEEQINQEDISDEQRGKLMAEMREVSHAMSRLNQVERNNLIEETAKNLGFETADAQEISAAIQDVIEATGGNDHHGFGSPHGGGASGRRPGGQGGPDGR